MAPKKLDPIPKDEAVKQLTAMGYTCEPGRGNHIILVRIGRAIPAHMTVDKDGMVSGLSIRRFATRMEEYKRMKQIKAE